MCGICGVIDRADEALAADMLGSIRHRGPDSFDTTVADGSSLGGCRLTIVPRDTTPLPFRAAATAQCLLLNGEIYNWQELAADLALSIDADDPDPESKVVAELIHQEGHPGISRLDGMFGLVAPNDDGVVLARDRVGIKPLFYAMVGDEIVFGSEIKALLKHPGVSVDLDGDALDETAVFGYMASPDRTPFKGIRQVPPGSTVTIEAGEAHMRRYWEPPRAFYTGSGDKSVDLEEVAASVRDTLQHSLGRMLQHDTHQKGFYLSGGIDSSFLVALAAQLQESSPATFTLADADDAPDLVAARSVARAVGADHHEFSVTLGDYLRELPIFVRHYESVLAGGVFDVHGGMAFQILSRHISEHVRVAFSGEGADELFGGYYWVYTHPLGFSDRIRSRLQALGDSAHAARLVDELFPEPEDESAYRRNLFDFLVRGGLSNYHLWSVDRSSSAFGSEVRPAYLDYGLADLALSLPIECKVQGHETKRVLREAARPLFESLGIEECLTRRKEGMPAAVRNLAVGLEEHVTDLVPMDHVEGHPYSRYVKTPLDAVMFDLFFFIFVVNRGDLPTGFDLDEFYRSGDHARMYC